MRTRMALGRRAGRFIFWMPLGFILVSGAALALILLLLRAEALRSGERLTQVFARLTEDQTTRTIQSVDQMLQLARTRLTSLGYVTTATTRETLLPVYRSYMVDRPFLRRVFVIDAQGRVVLDTNDNLLGSDLADRAYFRAVADAPDDVFAVHPPLVGSQSGLPVIAATRPWLRANGDFAGVVVAALDPTYFATIWEEKGAGQENFISLLRRDGILLMRSPFDAAAIGRSFSDSPMFRALDEHRENTIETVSPIDGLTRILSYRTLSAYPNLVISVSETFDFILATWRQYAAIAAASWVIASLALTALALWLRREWLRREAAEQELTLSWDRLSAVMDHTVDGLVVIDQRGKVLSFSKPAEAIFGYAADDVVGKNVHILMPEPYHSAHDGYISAYVRTGEAQIIGTGREVKGRRKDGTIFPMDLAVGEIPSVTGLRHFVGTIRDVTARKETEDQLRQAQKMEAVGQLTGGIAHDFNNMLAVMLGNVEIVREMEDDADKLSLLDTAQRAGERGAELTRRLLAFSRRQTLLPKRVDINRLVTDMVTLLQRTLGETIRVETRIAPEPTPTMVDTGQLENALLNLAVNARDAMPRGGVLSLSTGSVLLDEEYAGHRAEVTPGAYRLIAVSDNGCGMTAEVRERAFEPFFTTKEVGKGSGLGLSMVYGFVKQSGGHVSIYSEPGHGTTIRLYLPVSDDDQEAEHLVSAPVAGPFGEERKVLVVEDDGDVRVLIASMVERLGFVPILATDGVEALEMFDGDMNIALMITDVVMPRGVSGVDLAARVRETRPHLPVIFVSGYSDETEALVEVVRSGSALLSKPFSRAQLAEVIQASLHKHSLVDS